MQIRRAKESELPRLMEIYAYAREFMAAHGNPTQWGATNWPPESLIRQDIAAGKSYVCVEKERIVGVFFFQAGHQIDATYQVIENGSWIGNEDYGVVHRLAGDGSVKGIGKCCLDWAMEQCGHLRVDTHGDNQVLQNLLGTLGFTYCGIIHVEEDDAPRLAYEKVGK